MKLLGFQTHDPAKVRYKLNYYETYMSYQFFTSLMTIFYEGYICLFLKNNFVK